MIFIHFFPLPYLGWGQCDPTILYNCNNYKFFQVTISRPPSKFLKAYFNIKKIAPELHGLAMMKKTYLGHWWVNATQRFNHPDFNFFCYPYH